MEKFQFLNWILGRKFASQKARHDEGGKGDSYVPMSSWFFRQAQWRGVSPVASAALRETAVERKGRAKVRDCELGRVALDALM